MFNVAGNAVTPIRRLISRISILSLSLALSFALAHPARADDAGPGISNPSHGWSVGIGVGVVTRPYKDIDTETRVLPVLAFENRWIRVGGLGVDLKLGSAGPVSFALGARYSMNGYSQDDAPILNGMEERKDGVWVGPSVTWRAGFADLSAEVLGDAAGNSQGTQVRLAAERGFTSGAFRFTPRVAAIWRDRKSNDYYYGVRAAEVRVDRPFYEGTSSTDVEIGLRTSYALAPHHSVFLDLSATRLGSGVKDSPLVDRTSQAGARMGYLYRF